MIRCSRIVFLLAVIFVFFSSDAVVHAQTGCTADSPPVTTVADVAAMKAAGIEDARIGMCWDRKDANVGATQAQAKQDLQGMWCGNKAAQCSFNGATYSSTIDDLDPKFALCADKFMKQLRASDPTACIRSAYRSSAHQMCSCQGICRANSCPGLCAPPGNSYHQKGLAIDVNHPKVTKQQLWSIGSQSGLGNPLGLHVSDPDHMQVMNGGSNCSDIGYSPTDTDVFVPGPVQSNPYFNYGPAPMPSIAPQSFPGAPVPTVSTPAATTPAVTTTGTTATATSSGICSPVFSCSNNVMYYQTSSCTTQVYQTCANGCNGNSCAVITPTAGTSTLSATTQSTQASSTNDLLNALSNPVSLSAVPIGTAAPIAVTLNGNTSDVAGLNGNTTSSIVNPGTISSIQPITSQQTFTSSDLTNNSVSSYGTQSNSAVLKILADLKSALEWAINFLKLRT